MTDAPQTPASPDDDATTAADPRASATRSLDAGASPRAAESVFAHITADNAPIYRAILRAFALARQGFVLHLRPADVRRGLPDDAPAIADDLLTRSLDRLCEWGNLERHPDTAEVQTIEAFYQPRYLYRLTPRGEAAEGALARFSELLGQRGELQVAALADIRLALEELHGLAAERRPDAAIAASSLERVFTRLEGLTVRAQRFLDQLQRGFDDGMLDAVDLAVFKELVVHYLERFVGELLAIGPRIAQLVLELRERVALLLELAAERELQDALDPTDDERTATRARWSRRWRGLERWFLGDARQPSQAELLRSEARKAIVGLLSAVQLLHDRRQRRSDRAADLLELAAWFAEAPEEADCHRLWRAAFGLAPARHLATNTETLDAQQERDEGAQSSWLDATPLQVSLRLRQRGSYQKRGRRAPPIDRSAEKAALAARLRDERLQLEQARQALCTDGETTLSALGRLDRGSFDLLLDLLGAAVARKPPGGGATIASSTDGALRIELRPLENGAEARLETTDGQLRCRDHAVRILRENQGGEAPRSEAPRSEASRSEVRP